MGSCFGKPEKKHPVPMYMTRSTVKKPAGLGFEYDYGFKIVVIGDSGVGKSSLITRFADNSFTESYLPTIGVDFKIRTMDIDDKKVKLSIWDTAGQERFRTITSAYYRGANAIIVVFDITNIESYKNVERWLSDVSRYSNPDIPILLVGNKTDASNERQVSTEDASMFALEQGFKYYEVSAKDSSNVDEAFSSFAETLLKRVESLA